MTTKLSEPVALRYIAHMRLRNLRQMTIRVSIVELRALTRWNGGRPILYLDHAALSRWQAERSQKVKPESLRSSMSKVHGFYRWALAEGFIDTDPMARLIAPKVRRYLPRPIAEPKFLAAMAAADAWMRAVLALAAYAGLRACEIAALDWRDVDMCDRSMLLHGKGGRERIVSVADELADELEALPGSRRGSVLKRLDGQEKPNHAHTISHRANDFLHGLDMPDTLHSLRHLAATQLLDASDGDLRLVQDFLGHASPAATAIYTKVRPSRMRAAVQAAAKMTAPPKTAA
jgi:site-specific recombinase XerD